MPPVQYQCIGDLLAPVQTVQGDRGTRTIDINLGEISQLCGGKGCFRCRLILEKLNPWPNPKGSVFVHHENGRYGFLYIRKIVKNEFRRLTRLNLTGNFTERLDSPYWFTYKGSPASFSAC